MRKGHVSMDSSVPDERTRCKTNVESEDKEDWQSVEDDSMKEIPDIEQSRNCSADVLHDSCNIEADMPTVFAQPLHDTLESPTKKFKSDLFLDNYRPFLTGKPRLRKICDDQEIYEVEGVNVDLETLQSMGMGAHTNEVSVAPTIKFAHDYQDESSAAAANLTLQMQQESQDDSVQSDFLTDEHYEAYYTSDISLLRSVAQKLRENQDVTVASPESSCGTLSPEQDTVSPQLPSSLPKLKNNLDFPWAPLFEGKEGEEKSAGKKELRFAVPAAPGQTPHHQLLKTSGRKSPYRVTPHPNTGQTVMPAALKTNCKASVGQSPSLKGDISDDGNSTTPRQGMQKFVLTPLSKSNVILNSSASEEERSPADAPVPRTPFNTPVEGTCSSSTDLSAKQLEDLWKDCGDNAEDDGLQANRFQHNQKERVRRQRIKMSCDRLRTLIPGMTEKTDKATVFEFAAHYIAYLRSLLDHDYTPAYYKDFLKKATRLIAEEPL